jgi:hypothetical protein
MAKLTWEDRPYESGVDQGVLYLDGVPQVWNGLISVEEHVAVDIDTELYFDGVRRCLSKSLGDFEATIEAYTYPEEFFEYTGYSERLSDKRFGLSYRTYGSEGALLHVVYNALATPSPVTHSTMTNTPKPSTFSWGISTVPVYGPVHAPTAHLVIHTEENPEATALVEAMLYGTETDDPYFPELSEILEVFENHLVLRITYNGDGSWTATGPDSMINTLPDGSFEIISPTATPLDEDTFTVHSY